MKVTNSMSCAICRSEETTGGWHARRVYGYLPVCESCRTGEFFKEKYGIMLEKLAFRFPRSRFVEAITSCAHRMNFDGDCEACDRESGGMKFTDIDGAGQLVARRYVASETRAVFI